MIAERESPWPWQNRAPILAAIRGWDGRTTLQLADEPEAKGALRYASGALDGIVTHHMGSASARDQSDVVSSVLFSLERLARTQSDQARAALYELVMRGPMAAHADAIVDRLAAQRRLSRGDVLGPARWLVRTAAHREPLKLGIVLLGISGSSEDVEELMVLGRHDEFTLYAAVAVANLVDDPTDLWWRLARDLRGWGKIHLVERLAPAAAERADVRGWLVRDGCSNDVMDEYLAYLCATAGDLAGALAGAGPPDDGLIDGACVILGALLRGGPAEDIDSYAAGPPAARALVGILETRCDRLTRLDLLRELRAWLAGGTGELAGEGWSRRRELGWSRELCEELWARAGVVLARPEWRGRVAAAYLGDDAAERSLAWGLGAAIGLDLWEAGFARLTDEPLRDTLYFELLQGADPARVRRVVEFAERALPLGQIASGPADDLGFGPDYQAHTCLDFVLQELKRHRVFSGALVAAGLRSPTVRNRNLAAALLEVAAPGAWGDATVAALRASAADEPRGDLREKLKERLAALG